MSFLAVTHEGPVCHLRMTRPDKHNAFHPQLIEQLHHAFLEQSTNLSTRVIVLSGEGASFSAGADLEWMKSQGEASRADNVASAVRMAELFQAIDDCPKPVVAKVQGAALGGGAGLVCSVDIAIAGPQAVFGFTEVRLGLVAAVISPFVLRRIGYSQSRAKLLTGERFDAQEAYRIGLVHRLASDLDADVEKVVTELLAGSPQAQTASKQLLAEIWDRPGAEHLAPTTEAIAFARSSEDGREGLRAFLDKRKPNWNR